MDTHSPAVTTSTPPEPNANRVKPYDHPFVWLALLAALSLVAPYVPVRSFESIIVGAVVFTGLYVWFVVNLASSTARVFNVGRDGRGQRLPQVLAWGALALGLWAASEFGVKPHLEHLVATHKRYMPDPWGLVENLRVIWLTDQTIRPLALVAAATCGGVALSRMVRYPNMLGPLAGVAALIDIWGVLLGGIVSQLLTSPTSAPLASKAMAPLPTLGGGAPGIEDGISIASVGAGDFLFLGLFFGVLWTHRMEVRAAIWWIVPLVTLALASIALGFIGFLPGLLFIGLGATLPNLKYLHYTREERFALLYAGIFVAILTAALYFAITSQLQAPLK